MKRTVAGGSEIDDNSYAPVRPTGNRSTASAADLAAVTARLKLGTCERLSARISKDQCKANRKRGVFACSGCPGLKGQHGRR